MKKLFEEFKTYESLWEDVEEVPEDKGDSIDKEFELSASWEIAMDTCPESFELEYDGYIEDWEQDAWDYEASRYTTVSRATEYDDYTYEVYTEELLRVLMRDILVKQNLTPAKIAEVVKKIESQYRYSAYKAQAVNKAKKLISDYQKLEALYEKDNSLEEKLEIFVIDHLEDFFFIFNEDIKEYYEDDAKNHMIKHL
jgi:hypothetical protein